MLHLDGVVQSVRTIQSHYWADRDSVAPDVIDDCYGLKENPVGDLVYEKDGSLSCKRRNFFHAEILGRLSFFQITCIATDIIITQTLRGAIRILGGTATGEWKVVRDGFIDLASVLIQVVVLPLIALVSFVSPRGVAWLGTKMIKHLHRNEIENLSSKCSRCVIGTMLGIVSIPLSALRSALRVPINLLNGDLLDTAFALLYR